jgi:hypothetical protein
MPHFRKGYDERLDLTEAEYLAQLLDNADDLDDSTDWITASIVPAVSFPEPAPMFEVVAEFTVDIEGEPFEDTYLPGIPDYDRFNRPSWGEDE